MAASLNTNGVAYGDSTQQNTAFLGGRATVYTSGASTFTIPTGITAIKVTVVGGGGGGAGFSGCAYTNGGNGGTSSVSSGTQTISTISATGGSGGQGGVPGLRLGGLGSGGDLNGYGGAAAGQSQSPTAGSILSFVRSDGGNQVLGAGGFYIAIGGGVYSGSAGGHAIKWLTGLTPGNTLNYSVGAAGTSGTGGTSAGGAGAIIFEY